MAGTGGNTVSCGKGIDVGTVLGGGATAFAAGGAGAAGVVGTAGTTVAVPAAFVVVGAAMAGIAGVAGTVTTGAAVVVGVICGATCVKGTLLSDALPVPFCAFTLLIPNNPKEATKIKTIFFILYYLAIFLSNTNG